MCLVTGGVGSGEVETVLLGPQAPVEVDQSEDTHADETAKAVTGAEGTQGGDIAGGRGSWSFQVSGRGLPVWESTAFRTIKCRESDDLNTSFGPGEAGRKASSEREPNLCRAELPDVLVTEPASRRGGLPVGQSGESQ